MSDEKVEEGLRAYILNAGDIRVGISPELPDHVLLHVPRANAALAISLEMGYNLYDQICAALSVLEEKGEPKEELPQDKKSWN